MTSHRQLCPIKLYGEFTLHLLPTLRMFTDEFTLISSLYWGSFWYFSSPENIFWSFRLPLLSEVKVRENRMHSFVENFFLYQTDIAITLVNLGFLFTFSGHSQRPLISRILEPVYWEVCSPVRIYKNFCCESRSVSLLSLRLTVAEL